MKGMGQEVGVTGSKRRERPSVTVDVVVVAPVDGQPKVLLVKRKKPPFEGCWAIPGGFVEPDEPLYAAARRELREETGAEPAHLEQLHAFGDPGRDPRGWTISVAYLALLDEEKVQAWQPRPGSDAEAVGWFALADPPRLAFDHSDILAYARSVLDMRGSARRG
jgi:8-oxo-dGTP diphosphatase